jgi:hypothetical protein
VAVVEPLQVTEPLRRMLWRAPWSLPNFVFSSQKGTAYVQPGTAEATTESGARRSASRAHSAVGRTYGFDVSQPVIIGSDSALVRTAVEMADRHPPSDGLDGENWCLRCWAPWPCVPARHALEVCRAAGLGSRRARSAIVDFTAGLDDVLLIGRDSRPDSFRLDGVQNLIP